MKFEKVNQELLHSFMSDFPNVGKISDTSIEKRAKLSDRMHIVTSTLTFKQLEFCMDFCKKRKLKFSIIPISDYRIVIDIYEPLDFDKI